jgi:hypothetical protein
VETKTLEVAFFRWLVRGLAGVFAVGLVIYPADWAVWRTRVALGGGMDSVQVSRFTVAELKGSKEEYYPDGTDTVDCSRSIFPQGGNGACWWVRRHPTVIDRY